MGYGLATISFVRLPDFGRDEELDRPKADRMLWISGLLPT